MGRFVIVVSTAHDGEHNTAWTVAVACKACRQSVAVHVFDLDAERITHAEAVAHGDRLAAEAGGHRCPA